MLSKDWKGSTGTPQAPFRRGYDVETTGMQASDKGANCYLRDEADRTHILLHVVDITTNLALSGSTGQAMLNRDFYPKNFNQPVWQLTCQAPSQQHLGRIAEFIHKAQRNCIKRNSLMDLVFPSGGLRGTAASPSKDGMKGTHKGISMKGYIDRIPRLHRRHEPAPEYQFNFVVAHMRTGPFTDTPYVAHALVKWSDLVRMLTEGNLVRPPKTMTDIAHEQQANRDRDAVERITEVGSDFLESFFGK